MILLLDSHALVWWLNGDSRLSSPARQAIADPQNDVVVSAASVLELSMKRASGKLELERDIAADVDAAGFSGIAITLADAESAAALPPHHADPFDRMVVAHAIRLEAVVVTRDRALDAYGVPILLA